VNVQIATAGIFAVAGSTTHVSAQMVATEVRHPFTWDLTVTQSYTGAKIPIDTYDGPDGEQLRLIVVDDNLQMFREFALAQDGGTFRQRFDFPKTALYHVYAASTPHESGPLVFRFDFIAGNLTTRPVRTLGSASVDGTSVGNGTCAARFSIPELRHGMTQTIRVALQNGVTPTRAVLIAARDLTYAEPALTPAADGVTIAIKATAPGDYKLWLEAMDGAGKRCLSPLVLSIR